MGFPVDLLSHSPLTQNPQHWSLFSGPGSGVSPWIPDSSFSEVFWNKFLAAAFLSFGPSPFEAFWKPLN